MTSWHNAPESHAICSASPASVQPPSDEPAGSCVCVHRVSLRRCDECVACSRDHVPLLGLSDCHTPYPDTDVVHGRRDRVVRRSSSRSSQPAVSCRAHWHQPRPHPAVHRQHLRLCCVLCRFCRDPWGSDRLDPPKACLSHGCISRLPVEVHATQFVALSHEQRPGQFEHTSVDPALHGSVDGSIIAELARDGMPLASGACVIDHAVERFSLVDASSASACRRIKFIEDEFEVRPKLIGTPPDRGLCLASMMSSGHPGLLSGHP